MMLNAHLIQSKLDIWEDSSSKLIIIVTSGRFHLIILTKIATNTRTLPVRNILNSKLPKNLSNNSYNATKIHPCSQKRINKKRLFQMKQSLNHKKCATFQPNQNQQTCKLSNKTNRRILPQNIKVQPTFQLERCSAAQRTQYLWTLNANPTHQVLKFKRFFLVHQLIN